MEEVTFAGEESTLYGTLFGAGERGVVLCPPHPLYGGSRFDYRLTTVAEELEKNSIAALCFDYRRRFSRGEGEVRDAVAALRYLQARLKSKQIGILGYSFGAVVASNAAAKFDVRSMVLLAVLKQIDSISATVDQKCPKLFIHGKRDQIAPFAGFEELFQNASEPKQRLILVDEDHFFNYSAEEIARAVARFFRDCIE